MLSQKKKVVVNNNQQPSNNLTADMIAEALIKAQEAKQLHANVFGPSALQPSAESNLITVNPSYMQQNRVFASQPTNPGALYQYHLLVNEQELVRQQQMQRNNFMRMAMYSGY